MFWSCILIFAAMLSMSLLEVKCSIMIAAVCQDAVVIGCDSLASSFPFISTRFATQRVAQINPLTIICSASCHDVDFSRLVEISKKVSKDYSEYSSPCDGEEICLPTASVAKFVQRVLKSSLPEAHVIVAGIPSSLSSEPECYEILPGGTLIKQGVAIVGSASPLVVQLTKQLLQKEGGNDHRLLKYSEMAPHVLTILKSAIEGDLKSGGNMQIWVLRDKANGLQRL